MKLLQLAIITRHFWPHWGPVEAEIADLASAISKRQTLRNVLTIRWEKNWPTRFQVRELEVIRISRSVGGPWGMFRYLRRLHREVRDSCLNGLIVYGLTDESWAVIRNYANSIPLVVRIDSAQLNLALRRPFNARQLVYLRQVKRLLVDSESTARRLCEARWVDEQAIEVVPPLVSVDPDFQRSLARQNSIRHALTDAHPILEIKPSQPLVVCATAHLTDRGMLDLIDSWSIVHAQYPFARLWILGRHGQTRSLWERIVELQLADAIVLPGWFDDLDDVFQAADIYVHPLHQAQACAALNRARATGLCTIALQPPSLALANPADALGIVVPCHDPAVLAESIVRAIGSRDLRDRYGRATRRVASESFAVENWVSRFIDPFLASSPHV